MADVFKRQSFGADCLEDNISTETELRFLLCYACTTCFRLCLHKNALRRLFIALHLA